MHLWGTKKTVDVVHVVVVVAVAAVVGIVVVAVVLVVVVAVGLFETFSLWQDLDLRHVEITENLMVEVLPLGATE